MAAAHAQGSLVLTMAEQLQQCSHRIGAATLGWFWVDLQGFASANMDRHVVVRVPPVRNSSTIVTINVCSLLPGVCHLVQLTLTMVSDFMMTPVMVMAALHVSVKGMAPHVMPSVTL